MARQGFLSKKKQEVKTKIDFATAIDIDSFEKSVAEITLEDTFVLGEKGRLIYGIFHSVEGEAIPRRLIELEINPQVATGFFIRELESAEKRAGRDIEKHIAKVSEFLSKAIISIGGIPYKDLAASVSVSPRNYAERWYMPDVVMAIVAIRDITVKTRDYACLTQCPCPRNELIADDPEDNRPLHNLDDLNCSIIKDINAEPVYRVLLEDGFNDGRGEVKTIYISPMKFYATKALASQKDKLSDTVKMFREMVVGIPDSEVYSSSRGKIFDNSIFDLMTQTDLKILERACQKIQVGLETKFKIECNKCLQREWGDDDLNWLVQTKRFVYDSAEAPLNI